MQELDADSTRVKEGDGDESSESEAEEDEAAAAESAAAFGDNDDADAADPCGADGPPPAAESTEVVEDDDPDESDVNEPALFAEDEEDLMSDRMTDGEGGGESDDAGSLEKLRGLIDEQIVTGRGRKSHTLGNKAHGAAHTPA